MHDPKGLFCANIGKDDALLAVVARSLAVDAAGRSGLIDHARTVLSRPVREAVVGAPPHHPWSAFA